MFAKKIQQQQQLAGIENPIQRAFMAAGFGAQNFAEKRQHDFEIASGGISLDASIASSQARQHDQKLTASIIEQGAAADLAVRNAAPELREKTRKAQLESLEATRHELFDPHSGGYAASGSSYFMPGDPFQSSRDAKDRAEAAKALDAAKERVKNEKGQSLSFNDVKDFFGGMVKTVTDNLPQVPGNLIGNGS
jgi:hypothetical protein